VVRGRPKAPSLYLCPNPECRKPGSPFPKYVPRNDSTDLYFYPFFRHEDGTKACNLSEILGKYKARKEILVECDRSGNEATDFRYYPKHRHKILKKFPIKEAHINKAMPVVIYNLSHDVAPNLSELCQDCNNRLYYIHDLRCKTCNNTTIMWCPKCQRHRDFSKQISSSKTNTDRQELLKELEKSNIYVADLQDINWFLDISKCGNKTSNKISKGACNFLKRLSKMHSKINMIITYGDNAFENSDKISTLYNCESMHFIDKYAILHKLKKKIDRRKILSAKGIQHYNKPERILAD
jgi:hypothetical protein